MEEKLTKEQLKAKAFDKMQEFTQKKQKYEAELNQINEELLQLQKQIAEKE